MAGNTTSENPDWLVPAVLVATLVIVALFSGIFASVRGAGLEDDTLAGEFERWSTCLRSEGANVPLVEAVNDGGFRVTIDGSFFEEGLDHDALGPAMDACEEEVPEKIRSVLTVLDSIPDLPFLDMGTDVFEDFGIETSLLSS